MKHNKLLFQALLPLVESTNSARVLLVNLFSLDKQIALASDRKKVKKEWADFLKSAKQKVLILGIRQEGGTFKLFDLCSDQKEQLCLYQSSLDSEILYKDITHVFHYFGFIVAAIGDCEGQNILTNVDIPILFFASYELEHSLDYCRSLPRIIQISFHNQYHLGIVSVRLKSLPERIN